MHAEKLRNNTPEELRHQEQELSDQLFRLRFQLKMGQTESLKKLRDLRKDIARVKTILRQRELGIEVHPPSAAQKAPAGEGAEKAQKAPVKAAAAKKPIAHSKAKSAGKKTAGKKRSEKK
ncbi:MAG TPA: 50S ribosomal protein L29 [Terriglobales bacterium]|jgi:large subunit ribosomal protein L29|nr:50S ribosomal protein L29 [Terriglobales bacterium]